MKLINQLSKETGVSIATIRFYEKSGLFKGKKKEENNSNNYTYYDDEVVEKLELIRDAKSIGFTLAEIEEVIGAWYGKQLGKSGKIAILDQKLHKIEEKIKELKEMKKQLIYFKDEVQKYDC